MKTTSTLLFATAAAAYEYGYSAPSPSSTSTPCASAYTTVTPGGDKYGPVTVTSQYQTVPTYVPEASTYSDYVYVSTVITDADGKKCTVTKTEEPVTVYHSKSTKTHTTTYGPAPSAVPYGSNGTAPSYTTKTWEELCEKVVEIPYKNLGPHALPNYPGSGLCGKDCYGSEYEGHDQEYDDDAAKYQPACVKEYKDGKWTTYTVTYTYGVPTPQASTYANPGTYTVPEYDLTVYATKTYAAEATYTAPAHETVTYGGQYTECTKPTTITAAYATCETQGAETKTIIKTTTIYADQPGTYTIVKPTVTSYDESTVCTYPTAKVYAPGVYHHSAETVTITKSNQAYTCSYEQTSTYPVPTTTPAYPTKDAYPTEAYPTDTYSTETYPTASSTPCTTETYSDAYPTETYSTEAYPTETYSTEAYPTETYSTEAYPTAYSTEAYPTGTYSTEAYPTASSTPCTTGTETYPTASSTQPYHPDPSADYPEPAESYGSPSAGYVKRGGMLERRRAEEKKAPAGKRVILV